MKTTAVISLVMLIIFWFFLPFFNGPDTSYLSIVLSGFEKGIPTLGFVGIIAAILAKKK